MLTNSTNQDAEHDCCSRIHDDLLHLTGLYTEMLLWPVYMVPPK